MRCSCKKLTRRNSAWKQDILEKIGSDKTFNFCVIPEWWLVILVDEYYISTLPMDNVCVSCSVQHLHFRRLDGYEMLSSFPELTLSSSLIVLGCHFAETEAKRADWANLLC